MHTCTKVLFLLSNIFKNYKLNTQLIIYPNIQGVVFLTCYIRETRKINLNEENVNSKLILYGH